jgi:hypothetical protein
VLALESGPPFEGARGSVPLERARPKLSRAAWCEVELRVGVSLARRLGPPPVLLLLTVPLRVRVLVLARLSASPQVSSVWLAALALLLVLASECVLAVLVVRLRGCDGRASVCRLAMSCASLRGRSPPVSCESTDCTCSAVPRELSASWLRLRATAGGRGSGESGGGCGCGGDATLRRRSGCGVAPSNVKEERVRGDVSSGDIARPVAALLERRAGARGGGVTALRNVGTERRGGVAAQVRDEELLLPDASVRLAKLNSRPRPCARSGSSSAGACSSSMPRAAVSGSPAKRGAALATGVSSSPEEGIAMWDVVVGEAWGALAAAQTWMRDARAASGV